MQEIKLTVESKNYQTVMMILNNLKEDLIAEINSDGKPSTRYQPKQNRVIKENESGPADSSGKYLNPAQLKKKLKNSK